MLEGCKPASLLSFFNMFARIFISIILSLLFASSLCAQDVTTIKFDSYVLDMGSYPSDSCIISKEFAFTNTGDAKLYMLSSSPDCSCISVSLPKKPIFPGKKGVIKVTFDGSSKSLGCFSAWIYFQSNTSPERYRLRMFATKVDKNARFNSRDSHSSRHPSLPD